jgi:hypothetical protein
MKVTSLLFSSGPKIFDSFESEILVLQINMQLEVIKVIKVAIFENI